MILAKELRIGNLLQDKNGKAQEVDHLDIKWIYELLGDEERIGFKPIPLTEEWLLNLGFLTESYIATGDFMIRGSKIINIKSNRGNFDYNIIISADDYDNWRFIVETNPYSKDYKNVIDLTLKPLKFIHELQNTFHALTGEELQQKDPMDELLPLKPR